MAEFRSNVGMAIKSLNDGSASPSDGNSGYDDYHHKLDFLIRQSEKYEFIKSFGIYSVFIAYFVYMIYVILIANWQYLLSIKKKLQ